MNVFRFMAGFVSGVILSRLPEFHQFIDDAFQAAYIAALSLTQ